MDYEIEIRFDYIDHLFVAEVPDLPGCMAHGKTQVEAAENAVEAISLWLQTAKEFGYAIPQPSEHRLAA